MKTRAAHEKDHFNQAGRRKFLGTLGAGVAAFGGSGLLGSPHALAQRFVMREENFGRMFPNLAPFFARDSRSGGGRDGGRDGDRDGDRGGSRSSGGRSDSRSNDGVSSSRLTAINAAMADIGKLGGIMDAKDDLAAGPVALIVNLALSANNLNNTNQTAGTTFMGQFLDHDMTFDLTSRLGIPVDPEESPNARTPALDLDSVYGGGPKRSPELYQSGANRIKFKVESSGLFADLPRATNNNAILADPRNDENVILAGLQIAFLKFHNNAVDYVKARNRRMDDDEVFDEARRLTRWHYQWMIVHEFLPLFIGQELTDEILHGGRKFYRPRTAFIPVEFQGAVFRFGHTLVRPSYRANLRGDNGAPFFAMIFDPAGEGQADPVDLRGGARTPRRFIGWQTFFDFGPTFTDAPGNPNPAIRPNKRIDTRISSALFRLPTQTIAGFQAGQPVSLPQRNLLRHVTWSLPSGQSIAREIDVDPLTRSELSELGVYDLDLDRSTPLWFYIMREGDLRADGRTLGPVGGRIVGEVMIGLLELDHDSYLSRNRSWKPTLPQIGGQVTGDFRMIDFLTFAGEDPVSRGQ